MQQRINITLPENTVKLLDHVAPRGDRSRFIDRAVRRYVKDISKANLRKSLAEGAKRNAALDLEIAAEWFPLDEEAWQKGQI